MKRSLKDRINIFLYAAKSYLKPIVESVLDFWRHSLSREETVEFLKDSAVYEEQDDPIEMPAYQVDEENFLSVNAFRSPEHMETNWIDYDKEYVWKLERGGKIKQLSLCSSGTVLVNNNTLLNLDCGTTSGYRDLPIKPSGIHFPLVIAPWSHIVKLGYFGFLFMVVTKFCLIEKALGSDILAEAKLCYPAVGSKYELEYLSKLGVGRDALVDTKSRTRITADCMVLSNNQSSFGRISPSNVSLLRQRFLPQDFVASHRKIFLLRKSTRRVSNQDEVINLVSQYGFEIIPDTYRTVDEQIRLFREAAVIVTPHGAGLANLIWCNPGTRVIEFFNGSYHRPTFYYLSSLLGLRYGCLVDYTKGSISYRGCHATDIQVDIGLLRKKLDQIFTESMISPGL